MTRMVSRQSILDELQELRTLVRQNDCDQVLLRVRLLIRTCDRLTEPIPSHSTGGRYEPVIYAADNVGLSTSLVRTVRACLSEVGSVVESDPRRALKALDGA